MSEYKEPEASPPGELVLGPDNRTTFVQHEYRGGFSMEYPRAELSAAARAEAPEGALFSYRKVAVPRVGVDSLREALKARYGERQEPSE